MWTKKPVFWILFCVVQAVGLYLVASGRMHSGSIREIIGLILLLPGILLAIGMFAAFNILKSSSYFLLAPGILLAIGANAATWFGIWYGLENLRKKILRGSRR
jgi:ABC-type Fe3+ transport system permease subunit